MGTRLIVTRLPAWLAVMLGLVLMGCDRPQQPVLLTGAVMGTTWSVQVVGAVDDELPGVIQARLDDINNLMTTYSSESELARFNASPVTDWVAVSSELATVVAEAQRVARLTDGAFDVTALPLIELWGFGAAEVADELPAAQAIAAARSRVGHGRLEVRTVSPALRKSHGELAVDLSAIAKGYAVDQVAALLAAHGLADYLVEIGGELKGAGNNARGEPWNIAVEEPAPAARRIQGIFPLADLAVATSGDYRNFFRHDGKLYSHTIDPRSGYPVTHGLASVTVMDASAMSADAYATGLMVLGEQAGFEFATAHEIAALFLVREGGGFSERMTPMFKSLTARSG